MLEAMEFISFIAWAFVIYTAKPWTFSPFMTAVSIVGFVCSLYGGIMNARHRSDDEAIDRNYFTLRFQKSSNLVTRESELADRLPTFIENHSIADDERFVADCVLACMAAYEQAADQGGAADIHVQIRKDHPSGAVFSTRKQ